jgi:hypothetical protein
MQKIGHLIVMSFVIDSTWIMTIVPTLITWNLIWCIFFQKSHIVLMYLSSVWINHSNWFCFVCIYSELSLHVHFSRHYLMFLLSKLCKLLLLAYHPYHFFWIHHYFWVSKYILSFNNPSLHNWIMVKSFLVSWSHLCVLDVVQESRLVNFFKN